MAYQFDSYVYGFGVHVDIEVANARETAIDAISGDKKRRTNRRKVQRAIKKALQRVLSDDSQASKIDHANRFIEQYKAMTENG